MFKVNDKVVIKTGKNESQSQGYATIKRINLSAHVAFCEVVADIREDGANVIMTIPFSFDQMELV